MNKKEILSMKIKILEKALKNKDVAKTLEEKQKEHPEVLNSPDKTYKDIKIDKTR